MTITALATQNTQVGPSQFADMEAATTAPFVVDSPTDLKPSEGSNRTVSISAGAAMAGGSRVRSTSTETVTCQAVSSGIRYDAICLRIDWTAGTQRMVAIQGNSSGIVINTTGGPDKSKVNRIPGVLYDALIAVATVQSGSSNLYRLVDYRMWGGLGGPYRVNSLAIGTPGYFDVRRGTYIETDRSAETRRLDDDGIWRAIGSTSNPWVQWTPTLRYYGNSEINGKDGGTVAGLGNGGYMTGRYRIVDSILDGYVYIEPGATGATWGTGPLTIDLPYAMASWQGNTWSQGHFYNFGYSGEANFDWHAETLIKAGWKRGMLWSSQGGLESRLAPMQAAQYGTDIGGGVSAPGTGVPKINNGWTVGTITMHLSYPVDA